MKQFKNEAVKPTLVQLADPEFMCPKCGNKFYLIIDNEIIPDSKPSICENCGVAFKWNI